MRHFLILLGVVMAGLIGYRMEPGLRFSLTGITPARAAEKARTRAVANEPAVDPATLTPEQLPAKVMLKADVKVADATAEVTMTIPSGTRVSLVRIEGTNAVVSPGAGPYAGSLPISQTDLIEQLAANPSVAVTRPPAPAHARRVPRAQAAPDPG